MNNLHSQIREALRRYFPESNEEHIEYVATNLTSAVRGFTAMQIAQHTCGCEWNDGPDFCKGFNCAIRLATNILEEG